MMPNRPVVYRGTLVKKIAAVFWEGKHYQPTLKHLILLDQAQIKLLVDHLHEISDPGPGLLEILSILEPILEVSIKFIGCLKF